MSVDKNNNYNDPYFVGYYAMVNAFNGTNIRIGVKRSLNFIKVFFGAMDVILYQLDEHGNYIPLKDVSDVKNGFDINSQLLNISKDLLRKKEFLLLEPQNHKGITNIYYLPVSTHEHSYVLSFTNVHNEVCSLDQNSLYVLTQSIPIILERLEQFEKIQRSAYEDGLTGLYNRQKYKEKVGEIDRDLESPCVIAIFDLFRLKFINDNYSHQLGDQYILDAANILKKYFPEHIASYDKNGNVKYIPTGTTVYRIGGDEFLIISKTETEDLVNAKAQLAAEDVRKLSFAVQENIPVGLNYGISSRVAYEKSEEIFEAADKALQNDKREMYQALGLERRK